jgi:hypothetical protein
MLKYKDDFQNYLCSLLAKAGMPVMPRPRMSAIQRRHSKISLLLSWRSRNAGGAATQKYKDNFQIYLCSQLAKAGMPVMPRPRNSKIQRRLSKISLLSVGEGGNAGNAAAQNKRVYVVRALVRVHRLQVHHVSARAQTCRKQIFEKILKAKKRGLVNWLTFSPRK